MPNEDSNNIVEAEVLQLVHFTGHAVEIVGGLSLSIATFFAELYVHKKITKRVRVSNNKKGRMYSIWKIFHVIIFVPRIARKRRDNS